MYKKCPVCELELDRDFEVCPVCGFHLQGATQQFAPIKLDEAQTATTQASDSKKEAGLLLLNSMQKGTKYPLGDEEVTLGRDPNCTIFLNDMTVSRNHALIYDEGGVHIIKDQGSFNGVWVNNQSVSSKALSNGDKIQLGNFCFEYQA